MIFKNRKDAGRLLVEKLKTYQNQKDVIVLGLPRGGVVTAYEISKELHLPLDVICARKVSTPYNPELALGAVTELGEGYFNDSLIRQLGVSQKYLDQTVEKETKEAQRRSRLFRQGLPKLNLKNKTVILVDDGMATGATMKASICSVRSLEASKIVVALPVSSLDSLQEIKKDIDEVIVLLTPPFFTAVGEFYEDFSQISNQEVIETLAKAHKTGGK